MDVAVGSFRDHGLFCFFFQAEDGIRGLGRSRGLGDVDKGQPSIPIISEENEAAGSLSLLNNLGIPLPFPPNPFP